MTAELETTVAPAAAVTELVQPAPLPAAPTGIPHPRPCPAELSAVRHAESTANVAYDLAEATGSRDTGITQRDADIELSPLGRRQAAAFGRRLAALGEEEFPDVVICSPYRRTRQTARIALAEVAAAGRPLPEQHEDERLREQEYGLWCGVSWRRLREEHPREWAHYQRVGDFYFRPPGGESYPDVALRLRGLLADVHREYAGRRVLLVSHGTAIFLLRYVIDGLDEERLMELRRTHGWISNTGLTRWLPDAGGRLRLAGYNLTEHLADLSASD
ncbi:histidine phosphatase family protein [Allostreptomyces psammosilenae]|uniref:Broad specificity phosphatase PhoE n=1 Tax=Allostreptomyces psammosilenae TaxID=1892865 RepID=A0A852ZWG7_9ACTN|nr:histidine phosphatase family protein [Allostreptomyces psammosilenae]NYI06305.1 broad specificity phosphatase PhoE [Allostreptomyces psammosilenae]